MKTIATAVLLALSVVSAAQAIETSVPPAADPSARYTCDHQGVSRVALRAEPAPCCAGLFGCPQLLANTGLVKPKRANRT